MTAIEWFEKGVAYYEAKEYQDAVYANTRAVELDSKFAWAYYRRGLVYGKLGNSQQAYRDIKIAARLGHKPAQDFLRKERIDW